MPTEEDVLGALAGVRDPELDEPLTTLGFVAGVVVEGAAVEAHLRLPTYYCAPNFAYLMVADARGALLALDGVDEAVVVLDDHFASEEINGSVAADEGFAAAFPDQAQGELDELRALFVRKAFVARQSRVCDVLVRGGMDHARAAALRMRELPDTPDVRRVRALRGELGLDVAPDAPAFVRPDGEALDGASLGRWLRLARLVRLSLEGNAGLCRGMLRTRYGIEDPEEVAA